MIRTIYVGADEVIDPKRPFIFEHPKHRLYLSIFFLEKLLNNLQLGIFVVQVQ